MTQTSARADAYGPTAILVLLATCPGLITSTALGLSGPVIATSLGVSVTAVSWATILGNAALTLAAVVAADLSQRVAGRRLILSCLGVFTLGALVAAAAPTLPALVIGRLLQGFGAGLLLVVTIPTLTTGFPPRRLGSSLAALVMGLFGAASAGPLIGGALAQAELWRLLFVGDAVVGVVALLVGRAVLPRRPAPHPRARVDIPALALAVLGVGLTFEGVAQLGWHDWGAPVVDAPVILGVLALIALVVVEAARREPLMPVRELARTVPLLGGLLAIVGAFAFVGMLTLLPAFLERVRGLGARDTGLLLWPGVVAVLAGALVIGALFTTRWDPLVELLGLLCLALAAWRLAGVTAATGGATISWLSAVLGLGASLTVVPGMVKAALSLPPALIGRALAMISLLRFIAAYLAGPMLTHAAGVAATIHYAHLAAEAQPHSLASLAVDQTLARLTRLYAGQGLPPAQARERATAAVVQGIQGQALVLGLHDVFGVALVVTLAGIALVALALAFAAYQQRRRDKGEGAAHSGTLALGPGRGR